MLANFESICETEATIQARSRVHDVLGQRISLLLRSLREGKEPDPALLEPFAQGMPLEILRAGEAPSYSLERLREAFLGLGVRILLEGDMPRDGARSRCFYEIAMEAVTNAVRHGSATEIRISILRGEGLWRMEICDNGIPTDVAVTEGGGLQGMRDRAQRLGGKFGYEARGGFPIWVELPEGGEQ